MHARTHTRLTENAVSLEGAGLRQVGHEAHAVSSFPAVVAAQIWIADVHNKGFINNVGLR